MLSFTNRPPGTPEATASQPPAEPRTEDLRGAPRRAAHEVPSITGLRISPPGVDATLDNISPSGLLAECSERLKAGGAVSVVFEGTFEPRTVEARVARCAVSSMGNDGRLRYHVGISFAKPIHLDDAREGGASERAKPAEAGTPELKDAPRGKAEPGRAAGVRRGGAAGANDATTGGLGVNDGGTGAPGVSEVPRPVVRNRW